jgi:hypothetical protein
VKERSDEQADPSTNATRRFLKLTGALGESSGSSMVFTKRGEALSYSQQPPDTVETATDIIYSTASSAMRCGLR